MGVKLGELIAELTPEDLRDVNARTRKHLKEIEHASRNELRPVVRAGSRGIRRPQPTCRGTGVSTMTRANLVCDSVYGSAVSWPSIYL